MKTSVFEYHGLLLNYGDAPLQFQRLIFGLRSRLF